jgi:hypothetical protein
LSLSKQKEKGAVADGDKVNGFTDLSAADSVDMKKDEGGGGNQNDDEDDSLFVKPQVSNLYFLAILN